MSLSCDSDTCPCCETSTKLRGYPALGLPPICFECAVEWYDGGSTDPEVIGRRVNEQRIERLAEKTQGRRST